ncbi:hypothetical protein, partial [Vibrio parahaemolyticus]|uniref:hypothetical protein n=3 Tax=Vibrio parahaemolyticus TaxID=670 RepID=UPI001E5D9517
SLARNSEAFFISAQAGNERGLSQSGKLTGQVYPSSRRHFGDSFGAIQKTIPCITDFGDDVVVIRKRLVASTNSRLVR